MLSVDGQQGNVTESALSGKKSAILGDSFESPSPNKSWLLKPGNKIGNDNAMSVI